VNYEWAFIANWLIFGALTLLYVDPFDIFSSDDDDDDDTSDVDDEITTGITFIGENTDDTIDGTDGDDIILGLAGDDRITGGAGDDYIEGNVGDDTITGGAGDDSIAGGGGLDDISGGDGNDVISSDRLDGDAEWGRGAEETLSGGAGDDTLYFSGQDVAIGGEGNDSFNMIVDPEDGPAHITDFSAEDDRLTLYADYDAENPPEITTVADEETQTTSIMLGDQATVTLDGVFERDDLDIELKEEDDLELDYAANA
jgi:hypothetical protein